ncbi:pollen receptor-like kinase 2 [Euphorbia lathyris]|uniref:pollen receptor-like kinase 2 n=1 Tax=Euphorbia lathyris TaxID=212925 RepID=UPI0033140187
MPVKGGQAALPFINRSTSMAKPKSKPKLFLLNILLLNIIFYSSSSESSDSEILLKFRDSLSDASELDNWSTTDAPCNGSLANWRGVICVNDHIWGLRLERMGLNGELDFDVLEGMSDLKSLSVMYNNFEGPMPNVNKLTSLRSLFLANNHFTGEIPEDAFRGMWKLSKVFMGQNQFSGPIPSSLASIGKLVGVGLEDNKFTGNIPHFGGDSLVNFNVSNNHLEGEIPPTLSKLDLTSFSGNKDLCGPPLSPCETETETTETATPITPITNPPPPNNNNQPPETRVGTPSLASIIVVIIVAIVALAAIIAAGFILASRRGQRPPISLENPPPSNMHLKTCFTNPQNGQDSPTNKKLEAPKLSFVRDDRERFELPDLLKASAEILGSGCFGSSYKTALPTGPSMVVKRFKQMNNVGKEEFHEHMRRLGRLRHPNVLPLVAYYYRKEEKLLVSDFVHYGSLSIVLHGRQTEIQRKLNWPTRLNIIKGIGKGLAYLYKELPSIITAHGHLKSSNVLITDKFDPILADYGLVPIMNQENAHEFMAAYKSPEYMQLGRITRKTDVWCFGILIIELLTTKYPSIYLPNGKGSNEEDDLPSWVKSIPEKQWFDQVIDKEIEGAKKSENEIIKLLKIGLSCSEKDVEKRLDLKQVIERIDEIKENDEQDKEEDEDEEDEDDFKSTYAHSEYGDRRSSRGQSDDFVMIS